MPSVAASPSLLGDLTGRRLGRYEVLNQLASGGMATVYVARAQGVAGFERLVAIKVLHPHLAHDDEFISMFLDEARLAARIRHPNVVGTLDISDSEGDGYFLVMEYVEGDHFGGLLRSAAKGGHRLPTPVVARVVMDALAGLEAAHKLTDASGPLHLVHRDLSPHNILVGNDGVARITDFGVAKAQVRLSSTRDGQFKGKLSYMAPEQAAAGEADQRSDLFSMGIVLWEALTGRRLFRGENNAEVLNKILHPEVPAPSVFDANLAPFDRVALKALAREPDERFQTAEEFLEAVEQAAGHAGGVATARAVAREVNRWLGDKIQTEHAAIQTSIEALGRNDLEPGVLPRPAELGSQPSQPRSRVRPIAPEDATMGAKPSTVAASEPRRFPAIAGIALLVGLGLAGALGAILWITRGPSEPEPASTGESEVRAEALEPPAPNDAQATGAAPSDALPIEATPSDALPIEATPSDALPIQAAPLEARELEATALPSEPEPPAGALVPPAARSSSDADDERRSRRRRRSHDDEGADEDVLANPYSR